MKHLFPMVLVSAICATPAFAGTCEDLASLKLPDATITSAQSVAAGAVERMTDLPAFCRVAITSKPSSDSDIKIEVWLPASGWNGKFQAVGNGVWNGTINQNALATALRRGYAVAGTDQGHTGNGGPWMQSQEKLVDY